jgi:hypothetical protein
LGNSNSTRITSINPAVPKSLITLVGILLLLSFGCDDRDRIGRLEKQTQELKEDVKRAQVSTEYEMQAKCSRDAKAWFNENWQRDKSTMLLSYTNHYNKTQNKCFELVEYHYNLGDGSSWVGDIMLWDVYENTKYGNVSVTHMIYFKPVANTRESVGACEVLGMKCKGVDEFDRLVHPYMND